MVSSTSSVLGGTVPSLLESHPLTQQLYTLTLNHVRDARKIVCPAHDCEWVCKWWCRIFGYLINRKIGSPAGAIF